ncbi:MAG: type II toxin-antitoxin system prevent-host-death family antitoxin [Propionibacteriaceae bacterium]|nr:type II toxin-antitoxin system prevent-host-death family antitoxin [Propionibacteriaceae bacterium]
MSLVATENPSDMIGLRHLRAHLSSYVDDVKAGKTFTLTEHGKPVARLVPLAGQSAYEQLVAQGVIQPASRQPAEVESPITAAGPVSDLVAEQRR